METESRADGWMEAVLGAKRLKHRKGDPEQKEENSSFPETHWELKQVAENETARSDATYGGNVRGEV